MDTWKISDAIFTQAKPISFHSLSKERTKMDYRNIGYEDRW